MSITTALTVPEGSKAQRTYRALVEATRDEVAASGTFSGERVAERAGMAPATFYAYFPSKDEALAAALDDVLTRAVEGALGELNIVQLLDRGLRSVLQGAVAAGVAAFTDSAPVMRLALARLPESRTIRQVYREHEAHAATEFEQFITRGVAAGQLRVEDPVATTTTLLVILQGLNNPVLTHSRRNPKVLGLVVDMLQALLEPATNRLSE